MKLRNVQIERFKRLHSIDFDLDEVNILVGGNNSGKSTIIQAVHFAFTLFQSLTISNKWPAREKKSSTISPTELIYLPSEDPYSLGPGGRLLEDADKAIVVQFTFDNGEKIRLSIRKGRITNLIVEVTNMDFAKNVSQLNAPYSIFSPGLAGVSRTENYVSDGVLLRALARGDANIVLRNILYRLHEKQEWDAFEEDIKQIFPSVRLDVQFNREIDQYVSVSVLEGTRRIPLDLAGTGLLQTIQILAYFHLFAPKIINLDEPDSHLHPNNQRLLCSLLSLLAGERDVQVLVTTHSRHVLDTMYRDAKLHWVRDGSVAMAAPDEQLEILLELGALDIREKIGAKKYKAIFLTEDRVTNLITFLLEKCGFDLNQTAALSYNGVTSIHLLKPLVRQIKDVSEAVAIIVHRDRDFLDAEEIEKWKKEIIMIGAEPFVTSEIDVEGYFCTTSSIQSLCKAKGLDADKVKDLIISGEEDEIITSYVNGRVDIARKAGTIGQSDIGKISAHGAREARQRPFDLMKGKKRLAKLRKVLKEEFGFTHKIPDEASNPVDADLKKLATKLFGKPP